MNIYGGRGRITVDSIKVSTESEFILFSDSDDCLSIRGDGALEVFEDNYSIRRLKIDGELYIRPHELKRLKNLEILDLSYDYCPDTHIGNDQLEGCDNLKRVLGGYNIMKLDAYHGLKHQSELTASALGDEFGSIEPNGNYITIEANLNVNRIVMIGTLMCYGYELKSVNGDEYKFKILKELLYE